MNNPKFENLQGKIDVAGQKCRTIDIQHFNLIDCLIERLFLKYCPCRGDHILGIIDFTAGYSTYVS